MLFLLLFRLEVLPVFELDFFFALRLQEVLTYVEDLLANLFFVDVREFESVFEAEDSFLEAVMSVFACIN